MNNTQMIGHTRRFDGGEFPPSKRHNTARVQRQLPPPLLLLPLPPPPPPQQSLARIRVPAHAAASNHVTKPCTPGLGVQLESGCLQPSFDLSSMSKFHAGDMSMVDDEDEPEPESEDMDGIMFDDRDDLVEAIRERDENQQAAQNWAHSQESRSTPRILPQQQQQQQPPQQQQQQPQQQRLEIREQLEVVLGTGPDEFRQIILKLDYVVGKCQKNGIAAFCPDILNPECMLLDCVKWASHVIDDDAVASVFDGAVEVLLHLAAATKLQAKDTYKNFALTLRAPTAANSSWTLNQRHANWKVMLQQATRDDCDMLAFCARPSPYSVSARANTKSKTNKSVSLIPDSRIVYTVPKNGVATMLWTSVDSINNLALLVITAHPHFSAYRMNIVRSNVTASLQIPPRADKPGANNPDTITAVFVRDPNNAMLAPMAIVPVKQVVIRLFLAVRERLDRERECTPTGVENDKAHLVDPKHACGSVRDLFKRRYGQLIK